MSRQSSRSSPSRLCKRSSSLRAQRNSFARTVMPKKMTGLAGAGVTKRTTPTMTRIVPIAATASLRSRREGSIRHEVARRGPRGPLAGTYRRDSASFAPKARNTTPVVRSRTRTTAGRPRTRRTRVDAAISKANHAAPCTTWMHASRKV